MTPNEQYRDTLFIFCCFVLFFYIGVRGYRRHPVGGVLFVWETPEWFRTFENVTYIEKVVSSKWGKFNFASHTPLIIFVFILQIENHISDIDNWGGKFHDIYALKGTHLFYIRTNQSLCSILLGISFRLSATQSIWSLLFHFWAEL